MGELSALRKKHNEQCEWPMIQCWDESMGWLHCVCHTEAGTDNCLWHTNDKKPLR